MFYSFIPEDLIFRRVIFLDKPSYFKPAYLYFSYFSTKTYVVGTHQYHLSEFLLCTNMLSWRNKKNLLVTSIASDKTLFSTRGHPRGRFGRKSLPKLADISLSWAEGEVKMYRKYREIQNLGQNFSLKSWNFSLSENLRMTPVKSTEQKQLVFVLLLHENICCGYTLEVPRWGTSNE